MERIYHIVRLGNGSLEKLYLTSENEWSRLPARAHRWHPEAARSVAKECGARHEEVAHPDHIEALIHATALLDGNRIVPLR